MASADGPSCATSTSCPSSARTSASAVGGVVVVVDDEDRGSDSAAGSAASAASDSGASTASCSIASGASGSSTTNSLPWPRPSLLADTRAAVQLDQAAHDRQPEAEAALRAVERLRLLHEQVEDARRASRARCRCPGRARAAATRCSARSRRDADACCPGSLYFAALVSRFETTCARRSGSPSTARPSGGTSRSTCWRRCSSSGLAISMPARPRLRPAPGARFRSSTLPRVMRETSSRSSTSRTRWSTWRSMMSCSCGLAAAQPHQLQRREDRRQRVAQLVAEHGQELVLGPVGGLGGLRARSARGLPPPAASTAPRSAPRDHLLGHVQVEGHDAVDAAVGAAARASRRSSSTLGRSSAAAVVEKHQRLACPRARSPVSHHPTQQRRVLLAAELRHRLEQRLADDVPRRRSTRAVAGLRELDDEVRAAQDSRRSPAAVPAASAAASAFGSRTAWRSRVAARACAAHARHQLARGERLDQVVVGAGRQPLDARLLAGARRQHDDRDVRGAGVARAAPRSSPKPSRPGIITSVSTRSGGARRATLPAPACRRPRPRPASRCRSRRAT